MAAYPESQMTSPEIRKVLTEMTGLSRNQSLAQHVREAAVHLINYYGAVLDGRMGAGRRG